MSEDNTTVVDTGESQTVPETETQSEESISVSSNAKPEVEERDGRFFVNGQRMFTKAEKDAIAETST